MFPILLPTVRRMHDTMEGKVIGIILLGNNLRDSIIDKQIY